jgi:anthranilate phosphoribosyltransferase
MIKEAIAKLVGRESLTSKESEAVMQEIMSGETTPSQISAFITALRMKGETPEEIAGCAKAMRAHAIKVATKQNQVVDTCGTGGDGAGTFNISTIVAFVIAGAGLAVAKHGNRSVSSRCGSADVLEALGVKIELGPEEVARCLDEIGIGFLFAPRLHPAMKYAAIPRREVGIRTIFNLLGPLTNPASASIQLLGVYDPKLTETIAQVLRLLGTQNALVVHGADGLDELSTTGTNTVTRLRNDEISTFYLDPIQQGLPRADIAQLRGGLPEENAMIMRTLLQGEKGVRRNVVLFNAAAGLLVADKVSDFKEGLELAAMIIDSGQALQKLEQLIELSQSLAVSSRE